MAHLDMTCIEHRAPETARDTQMATIQTLKPMLGSVHHYAVNLVQGPISERQPSVEASAWTLVSSLRLV